MNKIILMGRLTKDVEIKMAGESTVGVFTLAVDREYSKEGEERKTDFIQVISWKKLGENAAKFLHKGNRALVLGRLQIRNFEDKNGVSRTKPEVVAESIEFIESNKNSVPDANLLNSPDANNNEFMESTITSGDDLPF